MDVARRPMPAPFAVAILAIGLAVGAAACTTAASPTGGSGGPVPSSSGLPTSSPSQSGPPAPTPSASLLSDAALKYRLIDAVGQPFFCDPDQYPVARADESSLAAARFPEIRADASTFEAIAARLGLDPAGQFDAAGQLAVYGQWKLLRAIDLGVAKDGRSFDVRVAAAGTPDAGQHITGTISPTGAVTVTSRVPAGVLTCPICLARGTRIATPAGDVRVEALRVGDAIWTFDAGGRRIAGAVVALGSTPVGTTHRVVRLVLSDGRTLEASSGHPLLDGRPLGTLRRGDTVDGAVVIAADLVPYDGGATFDLLASGPTGGYLADGVPLESTIRP